MIDAKKRDHRVYTYATSELKGVLSGDTLALGGLPNGNA
jgi:hypothetical protein